MGDLLVTTAEGLYCEAGGFYIDPWRPVERAVITHAHTDHARPGMGKYLTSAEGAAVLRERVEPGAVIEVAAYGESLTLGEARVSLHPAGHVLGSSQVRVEVGGEVWVVTGDYKRAADPTCRGFEVVKCDVLITEATFGLPVYQWDRPEAVFAQINAWWRGNVEQGRTSVVYAYALGKAQRVMQGLERGIGPILVHGAVARFEAAYRAAGVDLPETLPADAERAAAHRGRALVVAPPTATNPAWLRKFGDVSEAGASGWMAIRGQRRRRALDRGFVLSDHADWPGLLQTIEESGARRVGVTHGYSDVLARWLGSQGREAFVLPTSWESRAEDEEVG